MSVCAQCSVERNDGASLCPQHERESFDNWAEANRAICDWIHRRKPLPRLSLDEREEAFSGYQVRPWTPEVLRPFRLRDDGE
jgi:hypothetical protein